MIEAIFFFGLTFVSFLLFLRVLRIKTKKIKGFVCPDPNISCLKVANNIWLLKKAKEKSTTTDHIVQRSNQQQNNSLVVLIPWTNAKMEHAYKYADIWLQRDFDVLTVNLRAWQFLFPVIGSQVVAVDLLKFLDQNKSYSRIILHGLSVGSYVWSEALVQIADNVERYQHIVDRIVGQIWDSGADVCEIHIGIPVSIFPNNKIMSSALRKYVLFHLKIFDKVATRHYLKASHTFHSNMVRTPALVIVSKIDPIGTVSTNQRVGKLWEALGIKIYWKIFEDSPHVGHFKKYPEEYVAQISIFLDRLHKDVRSGVVQK